MWAWQLRPLAGMTATPLRGVRQELGSASPNWSTAQAKLVKSADRPRDRSFYKEGTVSATRTLQTCNHQIASPTFNSTPAPKQNVLETALRLSPVITQTRTVRNRKQINFKQPPSSHATSKPTAKEALRITQFAPIRRRSRYPSHGFSSQQNHPKNL